MKLFLSIAPKPLDFHAPVVYTVDMENRNGTEERANMEGLITEVTNEGVSYGLYDTGNGEAAYIVRDEDADEVVARTNGPIELITLRYELDIAKVI